MTFDETPMNHADIAAMTESAPTKRRRAAKIAPKPISALPRAPIEEGQDCFSSQMRDADLNTKVSRGSGYETDGASTLPADDSIPDAASPLLDTATTLPHREPYDPAPHADTIAEVVKLHRLRQDMIKAQTKLVLQAMASVRFMTHQDGDWDSDESKAAARKRADDLYRNVAKDEDHELHPHVSPYLQAMEPLEARRAALEKALVKAVKRLPVYTFVKDTNGFGDVSFATIVGECGDIGNYRSVSAVWKRLGLAVFDGKRQGNPGAGATAEDWIRHGYNKQRRSVSWNARNQIIGGMGMWRPAMGDDLADATYYQRVFAERARYEADKLGMPVTASAKGKESYRKHVTARAMRYTEKRLLRELYKAWRHLM